jgi:hypothetical protein
VVIAQPEDQINLPPSFHLHLMTLLSIYNNNNNSLETFARLADTKAKIHKPLDRTLAQLVNLHLPYP